MKFDSALSTAGAAGDDRRNLAGDGRCKNLRDRRPQGSDFDEPAHVEGALGEFSNRDQRSIDRNRPDGDIDARAVAQPRVDHWRRFVDPAPDGRDDPVDDPQEVRLVLEMDLGLLQLAEALNVATLVGVDQDVGNGGVLQQRFDWTIAGHLGDDLVRKNVELLLIEGHTFAADVVGDIGSNLLRQFVGRHLFQRRQIELIDDTFVQLELFVEQTRPAGDQIGVEIVRTRRRRLGTRIADRPVAFACILAAEKSHGHFPINRQIAISCRLDWRHIAYTCLGAADFSATQ